MPGTVYTVWAKHRLGPVFEAFSHTFDKSITFQAVAIFSLPQPRKTLPLLISPQPPPPLTSPAPVPVWTPRSFPPSCSSCSPVLSELDVVGDLTAEFALEPPVEFVQPWLLGSFSSVWFHRFGVRTKNFFSSFFFLMQIIFFLKSLLNLLQYCFCCLCFGFLGHQACGILVPWPGIKPASPALEGEVLTTGLQESPFNVFLGEDTGEDRGLLWWIPARTWERN